MDKKIETEEERQDRYRKKVLDEINELSTHSNIGKDVQSYGMQKKKSSVNFSKNKVEINESKDNVIHTKQENEKLNVGNIIFYIFCLAIFVGGVFAFPYINDFITKKQLRNENKEKVVVKKEPEKVYEKITLESPILNKLIYPELHPDQTKVDSYYKKDKVTVSELNNADILYTAYLDVYDGAFLPYSGGYSSKYCGLDSSKVYFNAEYITLRIENIFNKKTVFKHTDFYVPNGSNSKYTGLWKYDSTRNIYIYYGDCENNSFRYQYLDISIPYDVSASEKNVDLDVYSYLAFIKVDNDTKKYVIYRNSNYTDELSNGNLVTNNYKKELNTILNSLNKQEFKKYKYSFSVLNCAYQDYCFVSGEWVK